MDEAPWSWGKHCLRGKGLFQRTQKSAVLCLLVLFAQVVLDELGLLGSLALGSSFPHSIGLNDECRLSKSSGPAVPETRLGNHFQVHLWTVWL